MSTKKSEWEYSGAGLAVNRGSLLLGLRITSSAGRLPPKPDISTRIYGPEDNHSLFITSRRGLAALTTYQPTSTVMHSTTSIQSTRHTMLYKYAHWQKTMQPLQRCRCSGCNQPPLLRIFCEK